MNILYIGPLIPHPGGTAITCSQLLAEMARQGHRIRALSAITEAAYRNGDPMRDVSPGVDVTRYLTPFFEIDPGRPRDPAVYDDEARVFHRYVEAIEPDARPDVILAGRESISFKLPSLAAKLDVPWVLRLAGTAIRKVIENTYPAALAAPLRDSMRSADLLVTQARHMCELTKKLGHPRVAVVPNLVDLTLFKPGPKPMRLFHELGISPASTVVLHASNFKPVKRAADIVASAPSVLKENPGVVFVMAGDGPCRHDLERQSRENGTHPQFRFPGWVDYHHMPDYLALADLAVMPSDHEQQARMYLEAQASGRVLVASDIPAAREVVEDGVTGLLFRKGDIDHLAAQIGRAAQDPDLRHRIAEKALARVRVHAIDRVAGQFARELSDVVNRHEARAARAVRGLDASEPPESA
jgi:glycosyltransferase involved in cell wall biosynthesis